MKSFKQQNVQYLIAALVLVIGILSTASIVFAGGYGTPYSTPAPVCTPRWVWVADGPRETASCDEDEDSQSLSGGGGEGAPQGDVWIDALPHLVRQGGSSTISWGSSNAESCVVRYAGAVSFSGLSGEQPLQNINEQRTYILECVMDAGGTKTGSATITIVPVRRER